MKTLLTTLLCLSMYIVYAQIEPHAELNRKDNIIVVSITGSTAQATEALYRCLVLDGFVIEQKDTSVGVLQTKPRTKNYGFGNGDASSTISIILKETNGSTSVFYIRGTLTTFGVYGTTTPISNRGMKGSVLYGAFEKMLAIAKCPQGVTISYAKE